VHSYPVPRSKLTLHHADLYRLDSTGDVDDLALHELAEFGGIVLIEWGDVAASTLGDHLEVRLGRDDAEDDDGSGRDADDDAVADDFGLDETRSIELHATGLGWAGRWDRLRDDLEAYRC
jgi:tRNA threonylcarbamoyladenosine biosynthesis protein TsaE